MTTTTERLLSAGTVEEVRARGCTVGTGGGHALAVFPLGDRFAAVDNRCPHMGFPLDRGTVSNGILTCHWHHARFDLSSGGTFDPFADDVRAFPVTVTDGQVWVDPRPAGSRSRRAVVPPPRRRDGAQHPAGDRQVRPRTQLLPGRLPDAADDRRQLRHDLLRPRMGTGPDDDDLLGQHAREPPRRRSSARPLPGHQAGCRRMRRETSQVPGRSSTRRRDPAGGPEGMVPRLHRGP